MFRTYMAVALGLLLASCSTEAPKSAAKKEDKKAVEPVGGRFAYHQTFLTARTWAQDLQLLRVRDVKVDGAPAEPGKSAVWEITYVSPSKGKTRVFTYSVVDQPNNNIHEGVFSLGEGNWSGRDGQATAFLTAAFKVDSVDAWETAKAKSEEYMKKFPDMPVSYLLEKTPRHPDPAWRVIWGTSVASSGYSIFVDATTGAFLERAR